VHANEDPGICRFVPDCAASAKVNAVKGESRSKSHVNQQLYEKPKVLQPNAVVDPGAMVVHAQTASIAGAAVVNSRWLELVALVAHPFF
jgi:hypothetical protein